MLNLNKVECVVADKKKNIQYDLIDYRKIFIIFFAVICACFILLNCSVFAHEQAEKPIDLKVDDHLNGTTLEKPSIPEKESVEKVVPVKTLYDSKNEGFDIQLKPTGWFHSPN